MHTPSGLGEPVGHGSQGGALRDGGASGDRGVSGDRWAEDAVISGEGPEGPAWVQDRR